MEVSGQIHTHAGLTPGKERGAPVVIWQGAGWAPELVWTQCWAVVYSAMNLRFPQKAGYFLNSFSRRILFHGVSYLTLGLTNLWPFPQVPIRSLYTTGDKVYLAPQQTKSS